MGRQVKEHLVGMRARNAALQATYEELAPRFAVIDQLVAARVHARLSQRELAERVGMSPGVIGRLEAGNHSPSIDTLARVAEGLDCELDVRFKPRRRTTSPGAARKGSQPAA